MLPQFNSGMDFLIANVICALMLIVIYICWHAFVDANQQRQKTEALYNSQPRIKPYRTRLKWTGRLLSFFSFKNGRI